MNDEQRQDALLEAVRELVPQDEPVARPVPPPSMRRAAFALAAGWCFLGYLWIARPAWVFGEPPEAALTEARRDAALRFTLYLERGRLQEYADEHGGWPATLADAGPVEEGVRYVRQGDGFELTGELQGQTLRLTSAMDVDSFLGSSLSVLRQ